MRMERRRERPLFLNDRHLRGRKKSVSSGRLLPNRRDFFPPEFFPRNPSLLSAENFFPWLESAPVPNTLFFRVAEAKEEDSAVSCSCLCSTHFLNHSSRLFQRRVSGFGLFIRKLHGPGRWLA